MDWNTLLSQTTQVPREEIPSSWKAYPISSFEIDHRDIISHEALRNLQEDAW